MKSIKEILPEKTIPDLIHICKNLGLRGYTKLRKDGIVNLIGENVKNPQVQETIQYSIPDNGTVAFILKGLIGSKNEVDYSTLRSDVLKNRSSTTFRDNYRVLLAKSFIFEDDSSEEDIVLLPKEFSDIAKDIIQKRIQDSKPEPEIEEEPEEVIDKEILHIDQLLYSKKYTTVSSIQEELMNRNLKTLGTKDQLIERLLYETEEPIKDILNILFGKIELKEICRELELPVSGTKEALIERILERLPPAKTEKSPSFKKVAEPQPVAGVASGFAELSPAQSIPLQESEPEQGIESEIPEEQEIDIVKLIFNDLSNAWIDYKTVTDNKSLAGLLNTRLRNLPTLRGSDISRTDRSREEPYITVQLEEQNVVISPWYFNKSKGYKKQMMRISHELAIYRTQISENVICYIYDPQPKLSEEDIGIFSLNSQVIRKTERDFK